MSGKRGERPQYLAGKLPPVFDKRLHEATPNLAICAECSRGISQVALQHDGGAVVERMGQWRRRMNPLQAMLRQRQRGEKWRPHAQWMHGRSEVMQEAR